MWGGGLARGVWGGFRRRILTTFMGLIGMGAGILLVGFTPASLFALAGGGRLVGGGVFRVGFTPGSPFGMAVVGMFVAGFMTPITNGPIHAVLQAVVAPEMQGRVFTLVGSIAALMSPLGLMLPGPLSDLIGVRAWFIAGGVAMVVVG